MSGVRKGGVCKGDEVAGGGCDHDKVHTGIVRGTRSHDYRRLGTELTNRIVNFSAAIDRARLRDVK